MTTIEIIGIGIASGATILVGIWFMLKKSFNNGINSNSLTHLIKTVDNLPCAARGEEIVASKGKHDEMTRVLMSNNHLLAGIRNWVIKLEPGMVDILAPEIDIIAVKQSPRVLSPAGMGILKDINGISLLQDNKDFFFGLIDVEMPKTALDVEKIAHFACVSASDNDIFNPLKKYIYNAPSMILTNAKGEEIKRDLTLNTACYILSFPLKDMYLAEHPELLDGITDADIATAAAKVSDSGKEV